MLDYAACLALKQAGYPQDERLTRDFWVPNPTRPSRNNPPDPANPRDWNVIQGHGRWDTYAACPNSDELIAQIQARHPGANCSVWRQKLGQRHNGEYRAGVTWDRELALDEPMGPFADGDSAAAALATLYIALAKEQPCPQH